MPEGRHGAKLKRCSHEGCANGALQGGVSRGHGTKLKRCGVKVREGQRKYCINNGCANGAVKGGVCVSEAWRGAETLHLQPRGMHQWIPSGWSSCQARREGDECEVKTLQPRGVHQLFPNRRSFFRHGAKRKRCSHEGCTNLAAVGGMCMRRCSREGCTDLAVVGGVCMRHGVK